MSISYFLTARIAHLLGEWTDGIHTISGKLCQWREKPGEYESSDKLTETAMQFDKDELTRRTCLVGLILSYVVALIAIIWSKYATNTASTNEGAVAGLFINLRHSYKETVALCVDILVLAITETLGYIHATSLKWALYKEGRLKFNSNLRLFTSTYKCVPNHWTLNIIYLISLTMCYASASFFVILEDITDDGSRTLFSRTGPVCLGSCILVQAVICTFCMWKCWIPTWSSNAVNSAAVVLVMEGRHAQNRCLSAVHDELNIAPELQTPRATQNSAYRANKHVAWSVFNLCTTLYLFLAGSVILIAFTFISFPTTEPCWWSFLPQTTLGFDSQTPSIHAVPFPSTWGRWNDTYNLPPGLHIPSLDVMLFCAILVYTFLQIPVTIGAHCAELEITLARDEDCWRAIACANGLRQNKCAFRSAISSWRTIGLLVLKPIIHWVFGLAIQVDMQGGFWFFAPQVVYLVAFWLVLTVFSVYISFQKRKGPLPATYGHIQTIINLVDEWSPHMYWGDKGVLPGQTGPEEECVRHAGTSSHPLPAIHMGARYM